LPQDFQIRLDELSFLPLETTLTCVKKSYLLIISYSK